VVLSSSRRICDSSWPFSSSSCIIEGMIMLKYFPAESFTSAWMNPFSQRRTAMNERIYALMASHPKYPRTSRNTASNPALLNIRNKSSWASSLAGEVQCISLFQCPFGRCVVQLIYHFPIYARSSVCNCGGNVIWFPFSAGWIFSMSLSWLYVYVVVAVVICCCDWRCRETV